MDILIFIGKAILALIALIVVLLLLALKGKLESYSEWYNEHEVDK